jgi:hypothetical protein
VAEDSDESAAAWQQRQGWLADHGDHHAESIAA